MVKVGAVNFIKNTKLAEIPTELEGLNIPNKALFQDTEPNNKPSAAVVGDHLMTFTANVKGQHREDLQHAVCYAQLAAKYDHDITKDVQGYYSAYIDTLEHIGFGVTGFQFQEMSISGSIATVDKAILNILGSIATADEKGLVQSTLDAFKALPSDNNSVKIFNTAAARDKNSSFAIGLATQDENEDVAFKIGFFHLDASASDYQVLWFTLTNSSVKIQQGHQKMTLSDDIYKDVRDSIKEALGDSARNYISKIKLAK